MSYLPDVEISELGERERKSKRNIIYLIAN